MATPSKDAPLNWHENLIALLLAGVGGSIDAIGYRMFSGLFMGFMSGNSTLLGLNAGQQHWAKAGHFIFTILLFVVGVMIGARLDNQRLARALTLEAVLVAAVLVWQLVVNFDPTTSDAAYLFPRVALLAATMGIQAGALRRVGTQSIHTTFVTGDLTSLAALFAGSLPPSSAPVGGDNLERRVKNEDKGMLAGVWAVYVVGAAAGALLFGAYPRAALLLPLALLVAALPVSVRWPGKTA